MTRILREAVQNDLNLAFVVSNDGFRIRHEAVQNDSNLVCVVFFKEILAGFLRVEQIGIGD